MDGRLIPAPEMLAGDARVVAATLVVAKGSSPLPPGATMLVDEHDRIEGSVTGGCVEGALVEEAREVLAGGGPRLRTYGISDDIAAGVGLTCGGTVLILVAEFDGTTREALREAVAAEREGRPIAVATLLDGPSAGTRITVLEDRAIGTFAAGARLDAAVARDARGMLAQGVSGLRRYGPGGEEMGAELRVHVLSRQPPPRMVIVGAIDFTVALAHAARALGYDVTVCDAREPFVRSPRFSAAARVVVDRPDRYLDRLELTQRDAVLVFTHDPKFDEPALCAALRGGAGYVGALGSRRTHADRLERLRAAGVPEHDLGCIASPCGLDIGARTPEETAVSVLGEIVARRNGRPGRSLGDTEGPIHGRQVVSGVP